MVEALEYLRDRRPGPRDFSEEFLWWYSKNGALVTALAFYWAEAAWHGRVHFEPARQAISNADWPNIDSIYEGFLVQALTGDPVLTHKYAVPAPAGTAYSASDGTNIRLVFPSNASFGQGIPGGSGIDEKTAFFPAIFNAAPARTGRRPISGVSCIG